MRQGFSRTQDKVSRMNEYNNLTYDEIEAIIKQIDEGMRTTNGDTAPVTLTARQAAILVHAYGAEKRPAENDDIFANIHYMLKESPDEGSMYDSDSNRESKRTY